MCHRVSCGQKTAEEADSLPSPCEFWELNSGHQAEGVEARPLPAESSYQPFPWEFEGGPHAQ